MLHIFNRIYGNTGLAYISRYPRMVGVVSAVGGEVKGDREAFLAGGKVASVEGIGFFSSGEAGILADGPGPAHIHRGIGAAQIGRYA